MAIFNSYVSPFTRGYVKPLTATVPVDPTSQPFPKPLVTRQVVFYRSPRPEFGTSQEWPPKVDSRSRHNKSSPLWIYGSMGSMDKPGHSSNVNGVNGKNDVCICLSSSINGGMLLAMFDLQRVYYVYSSMFID